MPIGVQPGPVVEQIAKDLAWLRVPDLSGFTDEQIEAEFARMFSKSGLYPEWLAWLQEAVQRAAYGLTTMETARLQDLTSFDPDNPQPLFLDVQRIKGMFKDELVIISRNAPYFDFVD